MKFIRKNMKKIICVLMVASLLSQSLQGIVADASWVADIDNGYDNDYPVLNQNPAHAASYPVPQAVECNGKLYLTWVERNASGISQVRVCEYNGTAWTFIDGNGENGLNYDPAQDYANDVSIVASNGTIYVKWYEWSVSSPNGYFTHISKYNGTPGSWTRIDGGTAYGIRSNTSVSGTNYYLAQNLEMIDYQDTLYAVWTESLYGSSSYNIVLAKYNGSSWETIHSKLNTNTVGFNPALAVYKNELYISFEEGAASYTDSKQEIQVKKYDGSISDATGGAALDYDASINSTHNTRLISDGTYLYAVWNEINTSGHRQIRAKRFDGTAWNFIDGGTSTGINYDSQKNAYGTGVFCYGGELYVNWYEANSTQYSQMRIKKYNPSSDTWTFADDNGLTAGSGLPYGLNLYPDYSSVTANSLASYDGVLYLFWIEAGKLYVKKQDDSWSITSAAADLSNLQISEGTLYPDFDSNVTKYVVLVDNSVTNITITPSVFEPNATVTVNDMVVNSGTASGDIALDEGSNDVTVKVFSHRGVLIKNYVVKIIRYTAAGTILLSPTEDGSTYDGVSYSTDVSNFVGNDEYSSIGHSFEKFDYSFLQEGTITDAKLKLYLDDPLYNSTPVTGTTTFDFYYSDDDSWDETTATLPAKAGDIAAGLTMLPTTPVKEYYTFGQSGILSAVNASLDKVITFVFEAKPDTVGNFFFVSDDAPANKPILELTYVPPASSKKQITAFEFSGLSPSVAGTIEEADKTVRLTVPYGTDVTNLAPVITSNGVSISPGSGAAQDFTSPVTYTVTAEDGTTQDYTVIVTVAKNPAKELTGFIFNSFDPIVSGTVNEAAKTVLVTVPYGTDVTALVPTITHTGATISPNSNVAQDFTNPVAYTITAEDGTTQNYAVEVTVAKNPAKAITAFSFEELSPAVSGTVTESSHSISLNVPYGTDVTGLVPSISHSGLSIWPNAGIAQDFTNPVTYIVTAEDGTTQSYTVVVTVAKNPAKEITAFAFLGLLPVVSGTVDEGSHSISLTVPYGTDVTALVPTITQNGASVSPNTGAAQNFTNPVTYTVTAEDGSTQAYTVTVTVEKNPAKEITAFAFLGLSPVVSGTVEESSHSISLTVPYGTDVTALVPAITQSGASISPNTGVAQNFTNPVTYTVTAEDGSTQAYTVTVTVAKNPVKKINSFNFGGLTPGVAGTVNETDKTISLTVPYETDVTALVPSISYSGANISPNTGVAQDFTNPVTYTVTAEDGSTQAYTVTVTVAKNPAKEITAFAFLGLSPVVSGTVEESSHSISLTVPYGTDVTALVPAITQSGASISPNTGVAQNFTNPVTYTVTAEDGSTRTYTVTVTIAKNPVKKINSFNFGGLTPGVVGTVNETDKTVSLTVPYGTDVTALVPTINYSGAGISPNTGVAQNFTNPVTYTVTAEDGSTQSYTVSVTVAKNPAKAITAFAFLGLSPVVSGTVEESSHNISLTVPYGTDVTALAPTITQSGASISPNTGVARNFTNPVTYTVTAEDGSTQAYTVTVTVAKNPVKKINIFNFGGLTPGVAGTVNETDKTVSLTVPYETNVTALVPSISYSGANISPNTGAAQDFTNPVTYTVTAEDGSTQAYTVTVTVEKNPAKEITAFAFLGLFPVVSGTVEESSHSISLTVPYGTDVTALVPTITQSGASISPNTGVAQNFTNPVTYTVTAEDGSTQSYTVSVTVAKNPAKAITAFAFLGLSLAVSGVVEESSHSISLTVPYGTDVTALVPTITQSGASISPSTGVAQNFTNSVTYTVTAEDGSTQAYTVIVTVAKNPVKKINSFNFGGLTPGVAGIVNETGKTVSLTVPYGTDVTALVPTIDYSGAGISPNTGVAQNFTNPVTYTVTAEDGSTQSYKVSVIVAKNPAKAITAFAFLGLSPAVSGTVEESSHSISLTVPYGTDVTALVPTITQSGASISPNAGIARDFTNPVIYTVTAEDGSTQIYTVSLTVAKDSTKKIDSFHFGGLTPEATGTINEKNKTVSLTVPYGTDVTALVPTISYSGAGISPDTGVAQNFTNPVAYTVTAEDGSSQTYLVTVIKEPYRAPTIPDSTPTPSTTEKITVEVKEGDSETTAAKIEVERTTDSDGKKKDTVTYGEQKASETITKLKESGQNVARMIIPDEKDEVSTTNVSVPAKSISTLAEGAVSLKIETLNASIHISNESLQTVQSNLKESLYFNLVPVKQEEQKNEIATRIRAELGSPNNLNKNSITIFGRPVEIETNMPSTEVEIILPLSGINLPEDAAKREAFLKQLGVYIEHSDGEKEFVKGTVVEYKDGVPGIKFPITKFSTFTIVKLEDKSSACSVTKVTVPSGATISGKTITAKAENKTSSLTLKVSVSKKAGWKLYKDKGCRKELASHKLSLSVGKNVYYVKVTAEDGTQKVYKLTVTRKEAAGKSIVIANKYDFADAAAGSVLAGQLGGRVVRMGITGEDTEKMVSYIRKNYKTTDKIYIIGLGKAVNRNLEEQLKKAGYRYIIGIGGEDKYETAAKIAGKIALPKHPKAVLINGTIEPKEIKKIRDICGKKGYPILYVTKHELGGYTQKALMQIKPEEVYLIGGKGAISDEVSKEVEKLLGRSKTQISRSENIK